MDPRKLFGDEKTHIIVIIHQKMSLFLSDSSEKRENRALSLKQTLKAFLQPIYHSNRMNRKNRQ